MAGNGKSKDGNRASPNERADVQARSLQGANAPPREKPVIEGEAIKSETRESGATSDQTPENSSQIVPQTPDANALKTSGDASPESPPAVSEAAPQEGATAPVESEAVAAPEAPKEPEPTAGADAARVDAAATESPSVTPENPPPPAQAERQHVILWPIAVAILIGALIAVGGAYVLHSTDKVPKSLAALDARISALEHRPVPAPAEQADLTGLDKRIGTLESGAQSTAASLTHLQQTVQHLDAAQKQFETTLKEVAQKAAAKSAAPSPPPVDLAPLSARVGGLQDRLGKFEDRLASLNQRLDSLVAKFDDEMRKAQAAKEHSEQVTTARADANAVAIIAADLRRKVEAGVAFGEDLAALANHGIDKSALARLEPVAATGVASPQALAKQFAAAETSILATQPAPKKPEGFLGRLAQDAAHLVRIRKIGDVTGTDLPAHVARIDAALKAGQVDTALREWNDLPDAAKAKSKAFGEAAQRRVDALGAATTIEAGAMATLAKVKS